MQRLLLFRILSVFVAIGLVPAWHWVHLLAGIAPFALSLALLRSFLIFTISVALRGISIVLGFVRPLRVAGRAVGEEFIYLHFVSNFWFLGSEVIDPLANGFVGVEDAFLVSSIDEFKVGRFAGKDGEKQGVPFAVG